jgi:4-amino-4-deoxy-L-arabinose transferase-like glycosyltransferase
MNIKTFLAQSNLTKMCMINSFVVFIWWLVFNPGFFSNDSFAVIHMARVDEVTSGWTAIWALLVRFITINGSHPEIATLLFSQILAISVAIFADTLFKTKVAVWTSTIICITPLVGAMGITLWHDIPMTSGFLLFTSGVLRLLQKENHVKKLIIFGIILSSFRVNGLPTLIIAVIVFLILSRQKKQFCAILLLLVISLGFASNLDAKFSSPELEASDGFINWMRYDLSCYAAKTNNEKFFIENFDNNPSRQDWESKSACTWFNDSKVFIKRTDLTNQKTPQAWKRLALEEPFFVITTHLQRNAYLFPVPLFGLPRIPFIHTTIEVSNMGIRSWNPEVSEKLRIYPRIWNYFNFIFGYAGFWLLIVFVFAWRKRSFLFLSVGVIGLILNASLFVFAIISDGRYSLYTLITGQIILLEAILGKHPFNSLSTLKAKWQKRFEQN